MRLSGINYRLGSEHWLQDIELSLAPGGINVLLGATLAGKTTLLRIIAGLDRPTSGRLLQGDTDLTGVPVRQRNVAMVYQQFINYPSLTVYENIASPMRVARKSAAEIESRVTALAETLRLSPFLARYPAELSGGQQQRTALARALAKDAELLLLDEPLINLDYKLREELRAELAQLFADGRTTVVYATTEPLEALQLGGHTTLLAAGRVLQSGPTMQVFRRPATLAAARAFSDPPLNVLPARALGDSDKGEVLVGLRAHDLSLAGAPGYASLSGRVELAEISGSETFIHLAHDDGRIVAQIPGVHELALNEPCTLYVRPQSWFGFGADGHLLFAPES